MEEQQIIFNYIHPKKSFENTLTSPSHQLKCQNCKCKYVSCYTSFCWLTID